MKYTIQVEINFGMSPFWTDWITLSNKAIAEHIINLVHSDILCKDVVYRIIEVAD